MSKIDPVLKERLSILISSMGYEWVGGELHQQGHRMVFHLYIDTPSGVTLNDCSKVSHQVSAMLDVEDPIQGRYTLEVSSPGIDRPLFEVKHYQQYIGKRVTIKLHTATHGRRQYQGILQRVEGEDIYLLEDGATLEVKLPFSNIKKAHLIGDIRL